MSNIILDTMSGGETVATVEDAAGDNVQVVSSYAAGAQRNIFSRYLDAAGDGTGNKNFNGNYSGAQEIAYIQPGAGAIFRIARMIVMIEDGTGFRAERYGSLGAALTNGIQVRTQDTGGTLIDLTDGEPVTQNAQWGAKCYDVDLKSWGVGNEFLLIRWTFEKAGQYIRLVGANSERLEVTFDDDLTGLVTHNFMVQGYEE